MTEVKGKDLMKSGKLITLEGIEGVGKSSNLRFIADYLTQHSKDVFTTREPGGTPLAEDLRKILLSDYQEKTYPETELLILYAARYQHIECVIKPAMEKGKWVVCDRFNDATFAYQGAGRNIDIKKIEALDHWTLNGFSPSLTIILDAPVEVAFARIQKHRELDRFEKEKKDFFERIRQAYLMRASQNPQRYRIVDASQSLSQVQLSLRGILDEIL
jgi:dTMP kinase